MERAGVIVYPNTATPSLTLDQGLFVVLSFPAGIQSQALCEGSLTSLLPPAHLPLPQPAAKHLGLGTSSKCEG